MKTIGVFFSGRVVALNQTVFAAVFCNKLVEVKLWIRYLLRF